MNMKLSKYIIIGIIGLSLLLPSGAFATSETFTYTGSIQSYVIPTGVTSITITAQGATGGCQSGTNCGRGGTATGTLAVSSGETYYYCVGQQPTGTGGGFCGGGTAGVNARGGGGMTWFSTQNTFTTSTVIIVGGGGGGTYSTRYAGGGGGLTGSGGGGEAPGGGGSQTAGGTSSGTGGASNGSEGQGGNGAEGGGGGGGGYYGGGGGGANGGNYGGGGGGSAFLKSTLTATSTVNGASNTSGSNSFLVITYSSPSTGGTTCRIRGQGRCH